MPSLTTRDELLKRRLGVFTRMLHGVPRGEVRALHRTRVSSRRLRELVPVLQLDGDKADKLGRRLRRVTERLGAVRELDVLLMLLDELAESGRFDEGLLGELRAAVGDEQSAAREDLSSRLPESELEGLARKLEKIRRALAKKADEERSRRSAKALLWALDARVSRRAAAVKSAIEAAGALFLSERLHDVRISLKKLRYSVELAADVNQARASRDIRLLKRSQGVLGRLHDIQILIERVRKHQAQAPRALTGWRNADHLITGLEDECRRLHGRYVRERAKLLAICGRLTERTARTDVVKARRAS
jgi:CHAD domain-containing protein